MDESPATEDLVDLTPYIRSGDTVAWSQACGEPQLLLESLLAQRHEFGHIRAFAVSSFSNLLRPEYADTIDMISIGGLGDLANLARHSALEILPVHLESVPRLIATGAFHVDVALIQVSPADATGCHSTGLVSDYVQAIIDAARVVIGEVNPEVPYTFGSKPVPASKLTHLVTSSRRPVMLAPQVPGPAELAIGGAVASLVPDRATIQIGIGRVAQAVTLQLTSCRDLGIHSGMVGDELLSLIEAGVVTNAAKPIDTGLTVAGALMGSDRLYRWADHNPTLAMRPLEYTHSATTLSQFESFVAINSAIEIDLFGQVNAETVGGRFVGAIGGLGSFARAASTAAGGLSVIALPATAQGGARSRVVGRLSDGVVSLPRSDVDVVVTEHGCAYLRGCSIGERARRLIAVAAPQFRDSLAAEVR